MRTITEREVVLNERERSAYAKFNLLLDRGLAIWAAVYEVGRQFPDLSAVFFTWLAS